MCHSWHRPRARSSAGIARCASPWRRYTKLTVSFVYLRQGDAHRAIPALERALGLCQEWHIPIYLPWVAAALGLAYALDGRITAGLALAEQGVEQEVGRGRPGYLMLLVAWLSEAYLLAGRLEEAHQ